MNRNQMSITFVLTMIALCTLFMFGCSGDSITGPSEAPSRNETQPVASTPVPQPPQPVAETPGQQKGTIDGACFEIQNNLDINVRYYARIYEIVGAGEQQFRQELVSGSVPPGEKWNGCFDSLPCNYQIDLDGDYPVNTPAPGLLGSKIVTGNICEPVCKEGTLLSDITDEKFGKCNKVSESNGESCSYDECKYRTLTYETCTEEKRISIEEVGRQTVPLPGTWIEQEPVNENYGKWGECEEATQSSTSAAGIFSALSGGGPDYPTKPCTKDGVKSRTYDRVIYEINSCTEDKRVKSSTTNLIETAPCTFDTLCPLEFCHTENDKWCKNEEEWCKKADFTGSCKPYKDSDHGYIYYHIYEDCGRSSDGAVKKWQCQNRPPETNGHMEHFNDDNHDDFLGKCNTDKCYNILNP